ncbi:unnamed protein product, partial [Prorocentrum cordatum]
SPTGSGTASIATRAFTCPSSSIRTRASSSYTSLQLQFHSPSSRTPGTASGRTSPWIMEIPQAVVAASRSTRSTRTRHQDGGQATAS